MEAVFVGFALVFSALVALGLYVAGERKGEISELPTDIRAIGIFTLVVVWCLFLAAIGKGK